MVVHLGDGDWIVVDSCVNRSSREPVALEYLKSLGVDITERVKLVVATHWHDDHIRGISKVLRAAASAKFVDSGAYDSRELAKLVALGSKTGGNASVMEEYSSIYQVLKERRLRGERHDAVGPLHAIANRPLLKLSGTGRVLNAQVIALSPSDGTINRAKAELAHAIKQVRNRRGPVRQGPNQLSVALWLNVGAIQAILGADLEHVVGVTEGWTSIVASTERPQDRAGIFKVAHHGSKNADCPGCWETLLSTEPLAVVTPYAPSRLPGRNDLERLCKRTPQLFLTGDHLRYKAAKRDHSVERTLREGGLKLRPLEGQTGHVRFRADARDSSLVPEVELFNGAEKKCA